MKERMTPRRLAEFDFGLKMGKALILKEDSAIGQRIVSDFEELLNALHAEVDYSTELEVERDYWKSKAE